MNRDRIRSCIAELGHDARLTEDGSGLTVEFVANGRAVTLVHEFPEELLRVPKFHLVVGHDFGKLAHVLTDGDGDAGEVCIGDESSTAVNTDRPELSYRDTVEQHVQLLTCLIGDPVYNRMEQLREFDAHWQILCSKAPGSSTEIFVAWDGKGAESLQVRPPLTDSGTDLQKMPIALAGRFTNDPHLASVCAHAEWRTRQVLGKALGCWILH